MQTISRRTIFSVALLFTLSAGLVTPSAEGFCDPILNKKTLGYTILATALVSFVRLVTKKTQPKRVEPKSDSVLDTSWFIFDELMVGQMEKGERPSKVVLNQDNPTELSIEYSKVEARGVTGIVYSMMKPVIIPAITLMILFNEDFRDKLLKGVKASHDFATDPYEPLKEVYNVVVNAALPARLLPPVATKTPVTVLL